LEPNDSLPGALGQRLFEQAPDGILLSRLRDGLIVLTNEAMARLLGCAITQITGHSPEEFGLWPGPDERAELACTGPPRTARRQVQAQVTTCAGRLLEVEVSGGVVEFDNEPHAFAITRDVTERNAAQRALRESEERFRSLVQGSRDGIFVTNSAGQLAYVSPAAAEILGESVEGLVDRPERDLIHPQDLRLRDTRLLRLREDEWPQPMAELRMKHRDGSWRWVEAVATDRLAHPAVRGIITNFRDVTGRKSTEDAMALRALHDPLTSLPNRRLLDDRIEIALARAGLSRKAVAVLFCDLDGFNEVNDRFGHESGDKVLIEISQRLLRIIRPGDSLARLGGDEFVAVCGDLTNPQKAGRIAERMARAIRAPIQLDGEEIVITASLGVVATGSEQPAQGGAGALLRNADAAMYRAKQRGGNRWEVFDPQMVTHARIRATLIEELGAAVDAGQFETVFQPVVDLQTGRTVGAEALLRWRHPTRGLLYPADFLDVAESSGLIVPIGNWVLGNALDRLAEWHATIDPNLWVSVNVSGRQLGDRGVSEALTSRLAGNGLGRSLRLELTESVLIENSPRVVAELVAADAMGIRIGMDDFGTGYSSLTYLQRLPISFLKIDRRFLADLRPGVPAHLKSASPILLSAIIDLSHTLQIEAIAEGVENAGQAEALLELQCRYGQGFHFAVPASAETLSEQLRSERSGRRAAPAH
jgi:diguanylate cyclase (GGDEF)-like protein/PAS domain S-box-containing protein